MPEPEQIEIYWRNVHQRLQEEFERMTWEDWLNPATSMTQEEFERDPGRNKLSLLMARTSHLSFHLGQLRLLV